jgi:hypothetical protein
MSIAKERYATHRCDKWTTNVRNYSPIKGEEAHSQASVCSKQGIDNNFFRSNPANPVEHAQSCEKVTRDPVPIKTASHSNAKEVLMGHMALVVCAIAFVEGIEEGTIGQNTWPDHIRRPDNKLTKESTQTKAKGLGPKSKEELEAHRGRLAIENMLCECDIV